MSNAAKFVLNLRAHAVPTIPPHNRPPKTPPSSNTLKRNRSTPNSAASSTQSETESITPEAKKNRLTDVVNSESIEQFPDTPIFNDSHSLPPATPLRPSPPTRTMEAQLRKLSHDELVIYVLEREHEHGQTSQQCSRLEAQNQELTAKCDRLEETLRSLQAQVDGLARTNTQPPTDGPPIIPAPPTAPKGPSYAAAAASYRPRPHPDSEAVPLEVIEQGTMLTSRDKDPAKGLADYIAHWKAMQPKPKSARRVSPPTNDGSPQSGSSPAPTPRHVRLYFRWPEGRRSPKDTWSLLHGLRFKCSRIAGFSFIGSDVVEMLIRSDYTHTFTRRFCELPLCKITHLHDYDPAAAVNTVRVNTERAQTASDMCANRCRALITKEMVHIQSLESDPAARPAALTKAQTRRDMYMELFTKVTGRAWDPKIDTWGRPAAGAAVDTDGMQP